MGVFVITTRTNGQFQFNLVAGNGEIILTSEGYTSRANCLGGIASVRNNSIVDARYEKKISTNGKHYFNLCAGNGQVIGTSEMYESTQGRDRGIASVKANAPVAEVNDQS